MVAAAISFRVYYFQVHGEVQSIAYWTILGRIDQFVLGIVAFAYAPKLAQHGKMLVALFVGFMAFWWWFDSTGGFYGPAPSASPSPIWIWIPTI